MNFVIAIILKAIMKKIITITVNPTLDKSVLVPALIENQKLRCTDIKYEPGGGGINISRAIKKLGGSSKALFLAGGNFGLYFIDLFKKKKIEYESFSIKNETRESLIIFDESNAKQYLLDMQGPIVFENEWHHLLTHISKLINVDFIVASGSLPRAIPIDFYAQIAKIAKKIGAKFILDSSGEPLKLALNEGLYLIKPNLKEMGILTAINKIDKESAKVEALKIIKTNKCEAIVISLGADGALLVTNDFTEHFLAPEINVKSTVGAGDSMLAGIILKLAENDNLQNAVRYGVACGAAATMNSGTTLCNKVDADDLFENYDIRILTNFKSK